MKLIYIAAPYSTADPIEQQLNVQAARYAGHKLAQEGFYPVMPTVNTAGFNGANSDVEFWYDGTLELMKRCDAVYVLDGSHNSIGVQREIKVAKKLGMHVFITMVALIRSLRIE